MSLLVKVLFAAKAKSTHHKIALDALPRLTCREAAAWQEVFLRYHDPYLVGAKAPDDQFKDFKNHVLHVKDGFWGGAPATALKWYDKTVTAMRDQNWVDAAYCAGVLSHYVTDPVMPLHTGQCEAESPVHRPAEWSITKSYEKLRDILVKELGGYPTVTVPETDDWLGDMVRAAAVVAHGSYESVIDRYNMTLGVNDPPAGLDRVLQERIARLIGLATELFAQVLSRAIEESHQPAPPVDLTLDTLIASMNMPINWITKKIGDVKDRMQIEAIYREFQQTGKVIERLPEDDKLVRELHASEVLGVATHTLDPQPIRRIGALHGAPAARPGPQSSPQAAQPIIRNPQRVVTLRPTVTQPPVTRPTVTRPPRSAAEPTRTPVIPLAPPRQEPPAPAPVTVAATPCAPMAPPLPTTVAGLPRYYLERDRPVVDAPSIGPKTAERLQNVGIETVQDLLDCDPDAVAAQLDVRHISANTIRDWQAQAQLVCDVAGLRGHDAQILVACEINDLDTLSAQNPATLLDRVETFLSTSEGERILRGSTRPDLAEVTDWIQSARHWPQRRAA